MSTSSAPPLSNPPMSRATRDPAKAALTASTIFAPTGDCDSQAESC
ncbi:hypothetical protein U1872_00325 [Sphingomonas sp. RB3P16]